MSTKPYLSKLKGMITSPHQWDAFVEMLDAQVEQHQRKLEQSVEMSDVFKAQGAIQALRQLKYLKEEINAQ
jgi:hypothetical protein